MHKAGPAVIAAAVLALASTARGANVLSIENVTVPAGETLIEIPIDLDVGLNLTRLRFDVTFDRAFCGVLDDPTDLDVTSDGRNLTDPEDDVDYVCADGVLHIDVIDPAGAIDAGTGLILVIEIGDLKPDARGAFTFTPRNIQARAGTRNVPLAGNAGVLSITPTTSPTGPSDECPPATTFGAVGCRLNALVTRVEGALGPEASREAIFRRLVRANRAAGKAERLCDLGRTRRARALLQRAVRALMTFRRRLTSVANGRIPDDVRASLASRSDGVAADLRLLRERLECPGSSPSGAFLDPP